MRQTDEIITRGYFRFEEAQRQRLWMEYLLHPELMNWAKNGAPPPITRTKQIRIEELARLGFGEDHYQAMVAAEAQALQEMIDTFSDHPLAVPVSHIKGLGPRLGASFVAAAGDVERVQTITGFWKGMGLDVLPDGTVPRKTRSVRGRKPKDEIEENGTVRPRLIPALPHVTKIGELIRQQIVRGRGNLRGRYEVARAKYDAKYPDRPKLYNFKAAEREVQKVLYSCLFVYWRSAYGLSTPLPYAIDILKHDRGSYITIEDFYD